MWSYSTVGRWIQEIEFTFRDPQIQWMVFACVGVYFITFTLLQRRRVGRVTPCAPNGGQRIARPTSWFGNPELWLIIGLVITTLTYAFQYSAASKSTEALMLLGGIVLGKGAAFFVRWVGRVSPSAPGGGQGTARPTIVVFMLIALLLLACFWQSEELRQFQYRGQARWSGPWDNPNIFGMLMGVGIVLACGQGLLRVGNIQHSTFNTQHRTWKCGVWQWMATAFFVAAGAVMSFGLIKSYSRGAWLATAIGLAYLGCQALNRQIRGKRELTERETHLTPALSPHPMAGEGESSSRGLRVSRFADFLRRNWLPLSAILLSVVILTFWNYRHTERTVARRAFSVGNVNDFSWRNRVAAWEGGLQIMAERPWLGAGWNQPQRLYDHYYLPSKVSESAAIQLNDYLMLGMTLGIPALVCFGAYIALSLMRSGERKADTSPKSLTPSPSPIGWARVASDSPQSGEGVASLATCHMSLAATCRAGAVVLLVAFCFDGGLFKLATGATFWTLLELGKEE